jgi:hypothetical protein
VNDLANKTKKRRFCKETKGPKVQELGSSLFSSSPQHQEPEDDQLAKEITKLVLAITRKSSYTAADIARHRSLYNLERSLVKDRQTKVLPD